MLPSRSRILAEAIYFHIFVDISFYLFTCVRNRTSFFSISERKFRAEMEENRIYKSEYRSGNITQWFYRDIKLRMISVKIYAVIMVEVTSEIKRNI